MHSKRKSRRAQGASAGRQKMCAPGLPGRGSAQAQGLVSAQAQGLVEVQPLVCIPLELPAVNLLKVYLLPPHLRPRSPVPLAVAARGNAQAREVVCALRDGYPRQAVAVAEVEADEREAARVRLVAEAVGCLGHVARAVILVDDEHALGYRNVRGSLDDSVERAAARSALQQPAGDGGACEPAVFTREHDDERAPPLVRHVFGGLRGLVLHELQPVVGHSIAVQVPRNLLFDLPPLRDEAVCVARLGGNARRVYRGGLVLRGRARGGSQRREKKDEEQRGQAKSHRLLRNPFVIFAACGSFESAGIIREQESDANSDSKGAGVARLR